MARAGSWKLVTVPPCVLNRYRSFLGNSESWKVETAITLPVLYRTPRGILYPYSTVHSVLYGTSYVCPVRASMPSRLPAEVSSFLTNFF